MGGFLALSLAVKGQQLHHGYLGSAWLGPDIVCFGIV